MGKLMEQDKAEIQALYLKGQSTDYIAKQFGVSGQFIRKMAKDGDWKSLRASRAPTKANGRTVDSGVSNARELALLEAKSAENFKKDNPITREFILSELSKGVSPTAACRRVGIDHKTLAYWRQKDPDYDLRCHEAQADFISNVESLACGVSTPKDALNLLSRHPLTKDQWMPKEEKNVIKIEFAYNRHEANRHGNKVIDADYEEVPQIEAPQGSD